MERSSWWRAGSAWIVCWALVGCGSGRDDRAPDPALQDAGSARFEAVLGGLVAGEDVTDEDLLAARDAYLAAVNYSGRDYQSLFGLAITNVVIAGGQTLDALGLGADPGAARLAGVAGLGVIAARGCRRAVSLPGIAATRQELGRAVTLALPRSRGWQPGRQDDGGGLPDLGDLPEITYDDLANALREILTPALFTARAQLAEVAQVEDFVYVLELPNGVEEPIVLTVTQPEVLLILGVFDVLEGLARLPLAYNFTAEGDTGAPLTAAELADGLLTPAEYLPAAPFARLYPDGRTQSRRSLAAFQASAEDLLAAWLGIDAANTIFGADLDESADQLAAIFGSFALRSRAAAGRELTAEDRQAITDSLTEYAALFAGRYILDPTGLADLLGIDPATLPGDQAALGLNLAAFLTNPPADLRSVLPSFGLLGSDETGYDAVVGTEPETSTVFGDWPDNNGLVTFGGLLDPPIAENLLSQNLPLFVFGDFDEVTGDFTFVLDLGLF